MQGCGLESTKRGSAGSVERRREVHAHVGRICAFCRPCASANYPHIHRHTQTHTHTHTRSPPAFNRPILRPSVSSPPTRTSTYTYTCACACVRACICACMRACVRTRAKHAHGCIDTVQDHEPKAWQHICTCTHARTQKSVCTRCRRILTHAHTHTQMHACTCVSMHKYARVHARIMHPHPCASTCRMHAWGRYASANCASARLTPFH